MKKSLDPKETEIVEALQKEICLVLKQRRMKARLSNEGEVVITENGRRFVVQLLEII